MVSTATAWGVACLVGLVVTNDNSNCMDLCGNLNSAFNQTRWSKTVYHIDRQSCDGSRLLGSNSDETLKPSSEFCQGWYKRGPPSQPSEYTPLVYNFTYMLVVRHKISREVLPFYQLDLRTDKAKLSRVAKYSGLMDAVYIFSKKSLVTSAMLPLPLRVSFHQGLTNPNVVKTEAEMRSMAVDEERGIVFMASPQPNDQLYSFTTDGEGPKLITNLDKCSPNGIAVNTKHSVIYLSCRGTISEYTYDGKFVVDVITGRVGYQLRFDNVEQILYYVSGHGKDNSIQSLDLRGGTDEKICSPGFVIHDFQVIKEKVYATPQLADGRIHVFTQRGNPLKKIRAYSRGVRIKLCPMLLN